MCTGRIDLAFILRAFLKGADGVIVGGCWPGECHYVTEGNYDALGNVHLAKRILAHIGVDPGRLRIEWISASEGNRFAEVMTGFVERLKELGPLGRAEGLDEESLERKLEAVSRLVPYIKLVERERLRVPKRTEKAYGRHYESEETGILFDRLIADRMTVSEILLLLKKRPLATGEISGILDLSPSEVARHINRASRQGLVRFDVGRNCYTLA